MNELGQGIVCSKGLSWEVPGPKLGSQRSGPMWQPHHFWSVQFSPYCSDHAKSMFQNDQIISNPIWIYIYIYIYSIYNYILFKSHNLMFLLQFSMFPFFHFYLTPLKLHSDLRPPDLCRPRPARFLHQSPAVRNAPLLQKVATVPGQVQVQVASLVPSGKRLHSYWKSQFLMGKSTSMAIFNSYVSLPEGKCHVHPMGDHF